MDKVPGFTKSQREWILARDGNRCQFHWFDGKHWVRCRETRNLQVHHIIPRGWADFHLPKGFRLNGACNGITLCWKHHVGQFGVHPDTYVAQRRYNAGRKTAFVEMMVERQRLKERGQPYWNTKWDWMFFRIAKKTTLRYARGHIYPSRNKKPL